MKPLTVGAVCHTRTGTIEVYIGTPSTVRGVDGSPEKRLPDAGYWAESHIAFPLWTKVVRNKHGLLESVR